MRPYHIHYNMLCAHLLACASWIVWLYVCEARSCTSTAPPGSCISPFLPIFYILFMDQVIPPWFCCICLSVFMCVCAAAPLSLSGSSRGLLQFSEQWLPWRCSISPDSQQLWLFGLYSQAETTIISMYMHAYVQYLFSCMHIVCLSIHSNEIVHSKPSFRYFIDQKLVSPLFLCSCNLRRHLHLCHWRKFQSRMFPLFSIIWASAP